MMTLPTKTYKLSGTQFKWSESFAPSDNVTDMWIISFTQSLLTFVKREMAAYRLYTVLPSLMKFIDNLTNWYVRTNRKRIKGENTPEDSRAALDTLFSEKTGIFRNHFLQKNLGMRRKAEKGIGSE